MSLHCRNVALSALVSLLLAVSLGCSSPPESANTDGDCEPGDVAECICPDDTTAAMECTDDGVWGHCQCDHPEFHCEQDDDCDGDEICEGGFCSPAADDECTPGKLRCGDDGSIIEICNDDGTEWLEHDTCEETETCTDGACVPDQNTGVCQPGSLRCSDDETAVEICGDDGTEWLEDEACDSNEACIDESCTFVGTGDHAGTSVFAPDVQAHRDEYDLPDPPDWDDLSVTDQVHAVDDMGLDDTGQTSIVGDFNSQIDDGDEVVFPDGDYLVDGQLTLPDVSAIRPVDGADGDVTFVLAEGTIDHPTFNAMNTIEFGIKHVTLDETNDDTLAEIRATSDDILYIRDIVFDGFNGENPDDGGWKLTPNIFDSDGVGIVRDVVATDGAVLGESGVGHNSHKQHWPGGAWAGPNHEGTVYMVDNEMANMTDGALYMSRTPGPVVVAGGFYANSSGELVRLGSPHSFVGGGVDLEVDEAHSSPENNFDHIRNPRPIWFENRIHYPDDFGYVGDVYIRVDESTPHVAGGIDIGSPIGGGTILGPAHVEIEASGVPIFSADSPDDGTASYINQGGSWDEVDIHVQNLVGTVDADGGSLIEMTDRPGSVVEDVCIRELDDQGRDGVVFSGNNDDTAVQDSTVDVSGQTVVGADASNIDEDEDCD